MFILWLPFQGLKTREIPRPRPAGPPRRWVPGVPASALGPSAWRLSLQSERTTHEKQTRFSSPGTSGLKPDNMLFRVYSSLNPTKFHVYL